tara:strand:+ start:1852 stop:2013 length:162 start_codon:yes stop_codon:yes gene_type:complete
MISVNAGSLDKYQTAIKKEKRGWYSDMRQGVTLSNQKKQFALKLLTHKEVESS